MWGVGKHCIQRQVDKVIDEEMRMLTREDAMRALSKVISAEVAPHPATVFFEPSGPMPALRS